MIIYCYSNCTLRTPEKKIVRTETEHKTFLKLMISILTILLEPLPQHYRPSHYGQYERRRA